MKEFALNKIRIGLMRVNQANAFISDDKVDNYFIIEYWYYGIIVLDVVNKRIAANKQGST